MRSVDDAWLALSTGELARFIARPESVIADYRTRRAHSDLAHLLAHARRLAQAVDRLIVVAEGPMLAPLRAIIDACCHPFHNQLSRAERGAQPRIELVGDALDNDQLAGLVELVRHDRHLAGPEGVWGLMLIGDHRESDTLAAVSEVLLAELAESTGGERNLLRERSVSIAPIDSPGASRAFKFGVPQIASGIAVADAPDEVTSIFTIAGLLTAAALGIDVRRLLEGSAQLNAHFRAAPCARIWCCGSRPRAGSGGPKLHPAPRGWSPG